MKQQQWMPEIAVKKCENENSLLSVGNNALLKALTEAGEP